MTAFRLASRQFALLVIRDAQCRLLSHGRSRPSLLKHTRTSPYQQPSQAKKTNNFATVPNSTLASDTATSYENDDTRATQSASKQTRPSSAQRLAANRVNPHCHHVQSLRYVRSGQPSTLRRRSQTTAVSRGISLPSITASILKCCNSRYIFANSEASILSEWSFRSRSFCASSFRSPIRR